MLPIILITVFTEFEKVGVNSWKTNSVFIMFLRNQVGNIAYKLFYVLWKYIDIIYW